MINEELNKIFETKFKGLKLHLFDYLKSELSKRKQKENIQYYDDLLTKVYYALNGHEGHKLCRAVRKRYKAALIDEFQDTDPIQYSIFKELFFYPDHVLFLIGDPKQAIYSFRGADIFAYMRAAKLADNKNTLLRNWRSEPRLIEAINAVFDISINPFLYDGISYSKAKPAQPNKTDKLSIDGKPEAPFQLWCLKGNDSVVDKSGKIKAIGSTGARNTIVKAISSEIARLLKLAQKGGASIGDKPVKAGDIAVLVRTNAEAGLMKDTFTSHNIPCVIYSEADLFKSHEATELERVLRAVVESYNEKYIKAALATDMLGLSGQEIYNLFENDSEWETRLTGFRHYNELWQEYGFFRMIRHIVDSEDIRNRLLSFPDGERRLTNLLHLTEALNNISFEEQLNINGLLKWFTERIEKESPVIEEHQLRLESDENTVKIVTIHKSKGLEYPIVFCPFTWSNLKLNDDENMFHDEEDNYRLILDIGSDNFEQNKVKAIKEQLAENLRLLYVALTRAKNRCYLMWGRFNRAESSAMSYMVLQPEYYDSIELINKLESEYKNLSNEEFYSRLEEIKNRSNNAIDLNETPDYTGEKYQIQSYEDNKLSCRKFSGRIDRSWKIASYSYLISGAPYNRELPDRDSISATHDEKTMVKKKDQPDIFTFPKGAKAGSFFHEILEHHEFKDTDKDKLKSLVETKLVSFGYDNSWLDTVCNVIDNTLAAQLISKEDSLRLSQIDCSNRLNELEFYFPITMITPDRLSSIFSKHNSTGVSGSFPKKIQRLNFSPVKGFMKGFMDLVFFYNDRYYLVDWKSNYLGDSVDDYNPDRLHNVMQENHYLLQYHIYAVALNKYLSIRHPGYSYSKNFGGVYYLFLRGIDSSTGSKYGVFYDLPSEKLINDLTSDLIAGYNYR